MIIFTITVITAICLAALFLFKSFGVIPHNKFGAKIVLGKPKNKSMESGWYFAPWPFIKVVKITKELMMFKFTIKTAVTGRGKIEGYEKIVESIEIDIECAVYAQFDEDEASHIVQYAPGYDAQALGPFLVPYAADTVRALAGRIPWRLINRERYKSATWVQARLIGDSYYGIDDDNKTENIISFKPDRPEYKKIKNAIGEQPNFIIEKQPDIIVNKQPNIITEKELDGKSPFITLHLKSVQFVIENITFPAEVMTSIIAPEKAQLDGQAKIIASEAEKTKKIKEGEGDADARKKMLEAIKQDKDLEALATLKEIGKGPSNFIFSLPESVQKILEKIGG